MHPILLRIGPFGMLSYTALIGLGWLVGAVVACRQARRWGMRPVAVVDAALAASLGSLLGGRGVYVACHWAYYQDHVQQALQPWRDGGLSWHGALVGGKLAVLVYCLVRRCSFAHSWGRALDSLTPVAATLAIFAWLGCFLDGCAYGMETYPIQGALWALSLELPDLYGIWAPRVAVQLLGAGWGAVAMAIYWRWHLRGARHVKWPGASFLLWLVVYSAGSLGLGFLRGDEVPMLGGWRAEQVADLVLVVVSGLILVLGRSKNWLST